MKLETFYNKADMKGPAECWLWTSKRFWNGYPRVDIYVDGKRKTTKAHRYSYELAHGPIPKGQVVMHSCDQPMCVNPMHLRTGTLSDNTQDMVAKGRVGDVGKRKLDATKAQEIRELHTAGTSKRELARRYSVTHQMVMNVINGRSWKPQAS